MSMFSRLSTAGALLMAVSLSTADVAAKETLKVGCEGGFAPFTYIDDRGVLTGFDVDLIRMMGKKMGYDEVEITVYPFDGLIPALMTDNFDLIISGFTISEERAKRVDFSDPYYRCSLTYLVKKEHAQELAKIESLKDKTVCTQIGTTGAMYIEKALPGINLKQFNSPAESYIELQNDGCVATLNDRPVNDFYVTSSKVTNLASIEVADATKEYYGIAVKKGNTALLKRINEGLKTTIADGSFAQISDRWFGFDISTLL